MLVVGSRRFGPVRSALLGGVSARLIERAACPVVIVPRGVHTDGARVGRRRAAGTRMTPCRRARSPRSRSPASPPAACSPVRGRGAAATVVWGTVVAVALVALSVSVARELRRGRVGVDVIALLAMAGALALGEELAGAVIALMLAGGNALEEAAGRRARRDLTALLERAPRIAHRRSDGRLVEVDVDALVPGDVVVVRPGEVVPVDGLVHEGVAVLDESALTGEALPVTRTDGEPCASGTVCVGAAFALRAERSAADSAYSALVQLVRDAQAERAPFVRMADRWAVVFLPLTLALAGAAWAVSGDPVRALAVLVVATPCPLILAAPIAIVSGMSRTARAGVVVKDGGAIERLARARTVVIDNAFRDRGRRCRRHRGARGAARAYRPAAPITLLAPEAELTPRPASVAAPFGFGLPNALPSKPSGVTPSFSDTSARSRRSTPRRTRSPRAVAMSLATTSWSSPSVRDHARGCRVRSPSRVPRMLELTRLRDQLGVQTRIITDASGPRALHTLARDEAASGRSHRSVEPARPDASTRINRCDHLLPEASPISSPRVVVARHSPEASPGGRAGPCRGRRGRVSSGPRASTRRPMLE